MSIEVTRIGNGLTIALDHMPHLETVALGTWVRAGARNEREDEHGIAHLLEHMAFKGTAKRNARQIAEAIENVGGDVNAATSVETTAYHARMLGDDLRLGLDVLHDILRNSTFEETELSREKHVILQEIGAAQDTPDDLVFDVFQNTAYGGQPIGRPIFGTPDTVRGFSRKNLSDYLSSHYRGHNMVLTAAGKIDTKALFSEAEALFGEFSGDIPAPAETASYVGGDGLVERDTEETQIVMGFEGRAYQARDFYASQLLAMVLGGGMSSRLFQKIREERGYCYSIHAFHWSFSDTGVFVIHAATGSEDLPKLQPVIYDELLRAADTISEPEVDRARAQIRAGLMMARESPAARAGQAARQILLFGRPIPDDELMERLRAISAERLRELAGRLFTESRPTVAAVGDITNVLDADATARRLGVAKALKSA